MCYNTVLVVCERRATAAFLYSSHTFPVLKCCTSDALRRHPRIPYSTTCCTRATRFGGILAYYTCVGCVRATRFGGILQLTPHLVSDALWRHPHRAQITSDALWRHPRVRSHHPLVTHRNIAPQQDLASAGFCLARSVRDLHPALTPSRQSTTEYRYSFGPSVLR